jgi:hypothetical protein
MAARRWTGWLLGLVLALPILARGGSGLLVWRGGETASDDRPLAVGSLQKPFVAKAWAKAHPGVEPPVVVCAPGSGCWRASGHGRLGLQQALVVSCNTYFRALASDTPPEVLRATLEAEGFTVPQTVTPDEAIGLDGPGGGPVIRPSRLLAAYVALTRVPWVSGEEVRRAVLAGLRESPWDGTASGLGPGFWGKTGTVAAIDGRPLATSGLALAVDDSGAAVLGLLPEGNGREAARALGRVIAHGTALPTRETRPRGDLVRVQLFANLHPTLLVARNLGSASVGSSGGFVGPGGEIRVKPGDALDEGLWEVTLPDGLVRRIEGRLLCRGDARGRLGLVAEVSPREYVSGVLLAELVPGASMEHRIALGAAVLRFLSDGPRHGTVDVCDTTHCAWFVGRGPRVQWRSPSRFSLLGDPSEGIEGGTWQRILEAARNPGPRAWTAHCGGAPLSPHYVWGNGDHTVAACPRHGAGSAARWVRTWSDAVVEKAFGAPAGELSLVEVDGVWTLRAGGRDLRFDEAHRAVATVLGWDALPSPASRVRRVASGWEIEGVGSGHRVGLCLGD